VHLLSLLLNNRKDRLLTLRQCEPNLSTKSRASFEDFEVRTNRIAAGFLAAGLKPGECIGIWSPNHEEWIEEGFYNSLRREYEN
jgi:long-subunit acyl-CoA synthetase (AMP-forming)